MPLIHGQPDFVGLPIAKFFRAFSGERVFQQPRLIATVDPHRRIASRARLSGGSDQEDARYQDPAYDEAWSRCCCAPPDCAVKLSRVRTEEHGWKLGGLGEDKLKPILSFVQFLAKYAA
jgi:hypothetical protein